MTHRRGPDPVRLAEFAETARRLQREREEAAHVVERLLRDTPRERWKELASRTELQTCGALERLGNLVVETFKRDPRRSLPMAELALAIARNMPDSAYPRIVMAQVRAHAWKDVAQSLGYLGRNPEALDALDRAEAEIANFAALAHDRAIVRFVRAKTLQEVDRHNESMALLSECKEIFREYGDRRRLLLCGIAEGVLLHRLCKYREAREAYLLLLASTDDSLDRESAACLHNVIGHCSIDLGDYDSAETHLSRAAEIFEAIGQSMQAAKAELGRGRLLVRRGQVERGIAHLRVTRATFLRNDMAEEAGLCGLDIVEGLLLRSRHDEAETMARQIIAEFTAASLNTRAITALGYLREALAAKNASSALVTHVRNYIVSLRTAPEREFAAFA